ncbi:MAG: dTDP-4-dehydrorhamnose reductase [Candidatus Omnitrophota bacterium]
MNQRILITGSEGMLGIELSRELRGSYDVFGTDIFRVQKSELRGQKYFSCDITDRKGIAALLKKVNPDIVVHTAAWTDVDGCELDRKKAYRINTDGTKNVALACKSIDAILVYISTDFVFDGKKNMPYKERDKANPLGVYADSKLKGEVEVKKTLKRYFILRSSWLYGKHGKNFVDTVIVKAEKAGILKIVNDQVGSPTYTKDLASAIRALIDKRIKDFGVYHVSNSGRVSWYKYAKEIVRISGIKAKILPISSKELARPARRPSMSVMDNSKFVKVIGQRMRGWKSALQEYLS